MMITAEELRSFRSFYQGKRVVVTGAAGLLGSHLAAALMEAGARVRLVVHRAPLPTRYQEAEVAQADLTQEADCRRVMAKMEIAFLCAAVNIGGLEAARNPAAAVTSNLIIGARSLQAACSAGVERVLVVGSTSMYPPYARPVREHEAFLEEPHPAFQGVGHMKRYMEQLARFYHDKHGMKIALARPVPFYGRHDNFDFESCHVIPALIRKAVERRIPFSVWGTGDDVRDLLHVMDAVRGCLLLTQRYAVCDGVNLGWGSGVSIRALAEMITRLAGHHQPLVFETSKPSTVPVRIVDATKARDTIGFTPRVTLEAGLSDTINWFRSNRERVLAHVAPRTEEAMVDA